MTSPSRVVSTDEGLRSDSSANINVADSDFRDTWFGATFVKTSNLKVSDNFFTDLWHDAMRFVAVTNADITGNTYIEKGSEPGYPHKDFMQFWTNKANGEGPSKNVTITGNTFVSDDGYSHGIFILSEDNSMGKHQNFVIADNIIKSSQVHAITVDYTDNLTIKNNLIEQYGKGSTPVINVSPDSTNVNIIKNTAPSVPDQGNSTWTVSGNKETVKNAYHWTDGKTGTKVVNTGQPVGANTGEHTAPGNSGDGKATEFRFDGSDIKGTKASTVNNVNFSEGDTFVFIWYDEGTLADKDGGNLVWNNKSATYAKIDSIVDLQEIVAFSDKISSKVVGDDIILSIKQDSGVHNLTVTGLGHEFQSTWNDALF